MKDIVTGMACRVFYVILLMLILSVQDDASALVKQDASALVQQDASVVVNDDASVVVQHEAPALVKQDAPAVVKQDAQAVVKDDASTVLNQDSSHVVKYAPAVAQQDVTAVLSQDASTVIKEDASAVVKQYSSEVVKHDVSAVVNQDASAVVNDDASAVVKQDTSSVVIQDGCSTKVCECLRNATVARCSGKNLTYIPVLPGTVTNLRFRYNFIQHITEESLFNLTKIPLDTLIMTTCHINIIDMGVFQKLRDLAYLDLSKNLLTNASLYSIFNTSINSPIRSLTLRQTGITVLPTELSKHFKSRYPFTLDLSHNNIIEFNFTVLSSIRKLEGLTLKGNRVSRLIFDRIHFLKNFNLTNNNLIALPNFCPDKLPFFSKLEILNFYGNSINQWDPHKVSCMKKLQKLNLAYNNLALFQTDAFHDFPSLTDLLIHKQRNTNLFSLAARAFNNSRVNFISLRNNLMTSSQIHAEAFRGCQNVTRLDIGFNSFNSNEQKLNEILSPLIALQTLQLHRTRLTVIPDVIGQTLTNLSFIDVSGNMIKTWRQDLFLNNTNLLFLNAFGNQIKTVTKLMMPDYLRMRLRWIDLGENYFTCNCDIVWFIGWMHRNSQKVHSYPRTYSCLDITERVCLHNTSAFISLTTVVCFLCTVLFLASWVYKHRWAIKYHIYMWRYRPIKMLDIAAKQFIYDAFVSYSSEDADWVFDKLQKRMEDHENLKFCIHQRDFEVGKFIIDNIIYHMENSRKVLIILSNNFAKSEWCQFEMSLAQKLVLDMSIESVVVVLLEDIDAANMTKSLNALFKTTTYITWDEDGEEEMLWLRLKESLKKRDLDHDML